jgi:hypothetical protein
LDQDIIHAFVLRLVVPRFGVRRFAPLWKRVAWPSRALVSIMLGFISFRPRLDYSKAARIAALHTLGQRRWLTTCI